MLVEGLEMEEDTAETMCAIMCPKDTKISGKLKKCLKKCNETFDITKDPENNVWCQSLCYMSNGECKVPSEESTDMKKVSESECVEYFTD